LNERRRASTSAGLPLPPGLQGPATPASGTPRLTSAGLHVVRPPRQRESLFLQDSKAQRDSTSAGIHVIGTELSDIGKPGAAPSQRDSSARRDSHAAGHLGAARLPRGGTRSGTPRLTSAGLHVSGNPRQRDWTLRYRKACRGSLPAGHLGAARLPRGGTPWRVGTRSGTPSPGDVTGTVVTSSGKSFPMSEYLRWPPP
jgi:hypothetical protein